MERFAATRNAKGRAEKRSQLHMVIYGLMVLSRQFDATPFSSPYPCISAAYLACEWMT